MAVSRAGERSVRHRAGVQVVGARWRARCGARGCGSAVVRAAGLQSAKS